MTPPSETKRCSKCGETKARTAFHRNKSEKDGLGGWCAECVRPAQEKWKAENRGRYEDTKMAAHYRRKFKLSIEQFQAMDEAQGGVCAICAGGCMTFHRLSIDHCHHTGRIRGLLCNACNNGIGRLKDEPRLLARSITYLAKHGQLLTTEELADLLLHQKKHQENSDADPDRRL